MRVVRLTSMVERATALACDVTVTPLQLKKAMLNLAARRGRTHR